MSLLERFNLLDPEVRAAPYPYYAELRQKAPLFWMEPFKAYAVSRYEDVAHVLKNRALFSSAGVLIAGRERNLFNEQSVANLVTSDPPIHTRLRGLVNRAFTPKQIQALEPRVRELSRGLIEEMLAHDEFDFMDALASPLPVTIIAEMLGIDTVRRRDFKRWSDSLISSTTQRLMTGKTPDEVVRLRDEMHAYLTQVAEARRREPRADLISLIVRDSEGASALSPEEVNSFATLLLIAGNETTTNLLGNALTALIRHPDQYEWLRQNPTPEAYSAVCEETLRYDSPVLSLSRRATQDVELSGGRVPAGATVLALLGSANHDPARFPDPERYDLRRDTQGLMSFGHGIHFCLGAPLSRVEVPVALQELMQRAPRLRFAARQPERLQYGPAVLLRGPTSLWLTRG